MPMMLTLALYRQRLHTPFPVFLAPAGSADCMALTMKPGGQDVTHIKEDIAKLAQELQVLEQRQPEASAQSVSPAAETVPLRRATRPAQAKRDEEDEVCHPLSCRRCRATNIPPA